MKYQVAIKEMDGQWFGLIFPEEGNIGSLHPDGTCAPGREDCINELIAIFDKRSVYIFGDELVCGAGQTHIKKLPEHILKALDEMSKMIREQLHKE